MHSNWLFPAKILTGICALAVSSFSQTYTVSAKPGALNFIQGEVSINGDPVWRANLKTTFLNAGDTLAVENGKAEVLLTPGVFLRVGEHAQVRMIKPSLIETQVEVVSGESMIEVDDIVPGSSLDVMDHGSVTTMLKPGLFRFTEHNIAALDGKAEVAFGSKKLTLNKDKEVQIDDTLHASKVDLNQPDDLFAWSNGRSQVNAAASYAGSTQAYNSGGYGYSSFASPGWYWASGFNSYMWLPGNGAFYSPFGWGFYGPGLVAYAPVLGLPYYYGGYYNGYYPVTATNKPVKGIPAPVKVQTAQLSVPVNPNHVGVAEFRGASPAALESTRIVMQNYANFYGLHTASGTAPAVMRGGQTFSTMQAASHAAVQSSRAVASGSSHNSGGGWSGGSSSGYSAATSTGTTGNSSFGNSSSTGSMGGGHSGGGGASSGGGHAK
jgi:hypothetical protein